MTVLYLYLVVWGVTHWGFSVWASNCTYCVDLCHFSRFLAHLSPPATVTQVIVGFPNSLCCELGEGRACTRGIWLSWMSLKVEKGAKSWYGQHMNLHISSVNVTRVDHTNYVHLSPLSMKCFATICLGSQIPRVYIRSPDPLRRGTWLPRWC